MFTYVGFLMYIAVGILALSCSSRTNHEAQQQTYYFKFAQKSLFIDSFRVYSGSHTKVDLPIQYNHCIKTHNAVWLYGDSSVIIYDMQNQFKSKKVGEDYANYLRLMDIYWFPIMKPRFINRFNPLNPDVELLVYTNHIALKLHEKYDPNGFIRDPYRTLYYNTETRVIDSFDSYATIKSKEDYMMDTWRLDSVRSSSIVDLRMFSESYWDSVTGLYKLLTRHRPVDSSLIDTFSVPLIESQVALLIKKYQIMAEKVVIYFWYQACYPCHLLRDDLITVLKQDKDVAIIAINPFDSNNVINPIKEPGITYIFDMDKEFYRSFNVDLFPRMYLFKRSKYVGLINGYYDGILHEVSEHFQD